MGGNNHPVRCAELRKTIRVEKRAEVYSGKLCPHGHSGTRYVKGGECVECARAHHVKYMGDRPDARHRSSPRFRKLGLDLDAFNALLVKQDHKCAICNETVTEVNRDLHLDHCHASMKVRGILCRCCNLGIGYFKDNPDKLKNAIAYLERHANG